MKRHLAVIPAVLACAASVTAASPQQISVTLFGQPCQLSGPLSKTELTLLHSISPEQIPPIGSADEARKLLDRAKSKTGIPESLASYMERLKRYLSGELAFHAGLASARSTKNPQALRDAVRPYLKADVSDFDALAARLEKDWKGAELARQLQEAFERAAEPKPDAEFHSTIHRMGVHYYCAFEEAD